MKKKRPARVRFYVWIPVLFLATIWPLSYACREQLDVQTPRCSLQFKNGFGWVSFNVTRNSIGPFDLKNSFRRSHLDPDDSLYSKVYSAPGEYHFYSPVWVLVVTATVAAAAVTRVQGYKRPGLCVKCGYDLRASPGRCPECGTNI